MLKYILAIFTAVSLAVFGWLIYLYSQIRFDIDSIVNYKPKLTTRLYDKNNKLVANIFDKENRIYVKYDDIPPRVVEALVAIEDTQFFEHSGINLDAISRAIIKDIKAGKLVEGASTLTQQLVKTMLLSREKKIIRKIKEILLSLRLETLLTKEEILERYLNQIFFGHGYYGIQTASIGYFNKDIGQLNLKEIAMLVGIPRAPSFYDPTRNPDFSLTRANQVIQRMHTLGWINEEEFQKAINFQPTIYNQTLTQNKAPYIVDHVLRELSADIKDIKSGGYKIDLTIDLEAQDIARKALSFGYEQIKKRDAWYIEKNDQNATQDSKTKTLNGAIVVLENSTGKIQAMVGGVDYKTSSFNRATQSQRQPGSSIKPFLYQIALNLGYATNTNLVDISRTYKYESSDEEEKLWQPKNYEKNFKGLIPLREALVHSRNLATINLVTDIGIDVTYKKLLEYGFRDIPYDLSITLGSIGISPLELSHMYTMFSNQGTQVNPFMIESITNRDNQTISFEKEARHLFAPEQSFLMTSILKDTVDRGTGRRARVKGIEIAGKTGTTNNNIDAWFCGYSPSLQTLVWYGNDDNKPMQKSETGGRSAGPAFSYFYKNYLLKHPELQRKFEMPEGVIKSKINGKTEYFTETSKLSDSKVKMKTESFTNENIAF